MPKSYMLKLADPLPYSVRRLWYRIVFPSRYARLQAYRSPENKDGFQLSHLDDTRCIFIHVPKCGGSSIAKALFGEEHVGHATHRQYRMLFTKEEYLSYFKFAIVRNPWDRLVSAFHYLKGGGNGEADACWAEENLKQFNDFETFVREWLPSKKLDSTYWHFMTQAHFTNTEAGIKDLDFIGHFESMASDFKKIADTLGMDVELPYLNRSNRRSDYRSYYSDETASIAAEAYKVDIDTFGYKFDAPVAE